MLSLCLCLCLCSKCNPIILTKTLPPPPPPPPLQQAGGRTRKSQQEGGSSVEFTNYLRSMSSPQTDGDHVTLQALCDALKITIRIVKPTSFAPVSNSDIGADCCSPMGSGSVVGSVVGSGSGSVVGSGSGSVVGSGNGNGSGSGGSFAQAMGASSKIGGVAQIPSTNTMYITQEIVPRR